MKRLLVMTVLAAVLLPGGGARSADAFSLTTSAGRSFQREDVQGKVWVAYSFFASCQTSCPLTALQAGKLVKEFGDRSDFLVVGLTTDPEHDSPARLATLAASLHADAARWVLVTGRPESLRQLLESDFRIGFDPPGSGEHGGHASLLVLVGRDGKAQGYYRTGDREAFAKLRRDLRALLGRAAGVGIDQKLRN